MAQESRTLHSVKQCNPSAPRKNYESLQKVPLRRDWDRNVGYTNEVERMLKTGLPMMQHYFIQPARSANNPLAAFVTIETRPIDPLVGGTLGMTGGTNPYKEHGVNVGDHLVARVHADIPEIVGNTYNLFCVRNTYSIRRRQKLWELPADEVDKFYQRQLAAFSKSSENGIKFVGYMIFADLSEELKTNNNGQEYPWKVDPRLQDPHFEEFKKIMFCPKAQNGVAPEVPFCGLNLSLELTPAVNPNFKITENDHLNHYNLLRMRLRERKVEGEVKDLQFDHDIPDMAKKLVAFKEAIAEIADDMVGGSNKYRIALPNIAKEGFNVDCVSSDLICIMGHRDEAVLNSLVPSLIKPSEGGGFTPEALGVGRIIKTRGFKPGEALIIHKDALKFIIVENETGQMAEYKEPGVVNTGHSLGYYFDLFEMFPRVYIKPKTGQEITFKSYVVTPASDAS